jgi:hypothetical protein
VWFEDVWRLVIQSIPASTPSRPDPVNAIVLTNYAYHWDGERPTAGSEHAYMVTMFAKHPISQEVMAAVLRAVENYGDQVLEAADPWSHALDGEEGRDDAGEDRDQHDADEHPHRGHHTTGQGSGALSP